MGYGLDLGPTHGGTHGLFPRLQSSTSVLLIDVEFPSVGIGQTL